MLMLGVALLAPILAAVNALDRRGFFDKYLQDSEIHAMGDQLVLSIEAWQSRHGRYPKSLAEANLTSPTAHQGGFRYVCESKAFTLSLGYGGGTMVHTFRSAGIDKRIGVPGWDCRD